MIVRAGKSTMGSAEERAIAESEEALSAAAFTSAAQYSVRSTTSDLLLAGGYTLFVKKGESDAASCAARRLARCLREDN